MFNYPLKILTLNIKGGGINNDSKINLFNNITKNNNIDISILTETRLFNHSSLKFDKIEEFNPNSGLIIILHNNILKIKYYKSIYCGRAIFFQIETPTSINLKILAVYAPAKKNSKKEFWDHLNNLNLEIDLMVGDLNISEEEPDYFSNFITKNNLIDVANFLNKTHLHTLNHYNKKHYRPDRVYFNMNTRFLKQELFTNAFFLSDHNALIFAINSTTKKIITNNYYTIPKKQNRIHCFNI